MKRAGRDTVGDPLQPKQARISQIKAGSQTRGNHMADKEPTEREIAAAKAARARLFGGEGSPRVRQLTVVTSAPVIFDVIAMPHQAFLPTLCNKMGSCPVTRTCALKPLSCRTQEAEVPAAREPTGTAPKPTVDVEQLPYEELTALETPETDAKVRCQHGECCKNACCFQQAAVQVIARDRCKRSCYNQIVTVQAALADMGSADWAIACRGLLTVRRLSKHHPRECTALL